MPTIKEGLLGTDEQNRIAQELEDRIAAKDPNSPQAKYQALVQTGLNILGQGQGRKKPEEAAQSFTGNVGKGAAEGLKTYKEKQGMKKGGKVSSASKRADGIAQRGKTKGRMV